MKNKRKLFKLYTYQKVIIAYLITVTICAWALHPVMHKILNYPPGTVDTQFQIDYGGLSYTNQFILIYIFVVLIFLVYLRFFLFRKIASWERSKNPNKYNDTAIKKIRKILINAPTKFYLLQIIVPFLAIIIGLGLPIVKHEVEVSGMSVAIIWVSIFTFNATIAYVFSKNLFKSLLVKTYAENDIKFRHNGLVQDILLLLLPLLIAGLFFTTIVSYSRLINARGNDIFKYYRYELDLVFDEDKSYSPNEVINKLETLNYMNETDTYFIIDSKKNVLTSDNVELTDFFLKYIYELSDQYEGRVYEHYAVNTQGIIKHITVNNSSYMLGIKYPISGGDSLFYMVSTFIILFGVIAFLLWYYSSYLSSQIKLIINGLNEINNKNNADFNEIPVISNDELGELTVAFNKIQDLTKQNIEQIHSSQDILMEKERLASLGQMIGGIAHNLKTPIMSTSGASEGLLDLINEYKNSIGDKEVSVQDHQEIAKDMEEWVNKIKSYTSYMSDIISAVKGQAVNMNDQTYAPFTLDELVKRIDILMKHELKNALINLEINMEADKNIVLKGNLNSLIQVINNMISNSIQAYAGKTDQKIELSFKQDRNKVIITIKDYASGMSKEVQERLFNSMITTKGKNGTGLGLFMSYSTIKGNFNGDITFTSQEGKGTTFNIILPLT